MATQADLAAHLDLSQPAVSAMLAEGTLPAAAKRGSLDLDACRVAYIRRLREQAAGRAAVTEEEDEPDLVRERALLARAQREGHNLKNAVMRSELLPLDDMEEVVGGVLDAVRAKLLSLPTKGAAQLLGLTNAAEARDLLTRLVHDALTDLAGTAVVIRDIADRARRRLGRAGSDGAADAEASPPAAADSQRMG